MEFFEAIRANLTSPAILFFVLGVVAAVVKTDLRFPEPLYLGLTMYICSWPSVSKAAWPFPRRE